MDSKKVQLYLDREKAIEASPVTGANCVILSDGNDLQKVLNNDLTNPTVVHEETSFKVGVGDINVSSSVVDGEVGRMVIKGKTYQNILPEPSTHVLTNNKEMFKVNEGLDPNVEIVDGVSKSAILKGKTINNLWTNSTQGVNVQQRTDGTVIEFYSEQYERVTFGESQVNSATTVGIRTTQKLQANKTYYINTFVFDALNVTDSFLIRDADNSINLNTLKIEGYPPGQILSFTTQAETNNIIFYYFAYTRKYGAVNYGKPFYMPKRFIISDKLEDVVNQEFFTGMQSVKLPVLKTVGKNLFDGKERIWFIDNNGVIPENTGWRDWITDSYIQIKGDTPYFSNITENKSFYFYDSNKSFISSNHNVWASSVTSPTNARYLLVKIAAFKELGQNVAIYEGEYKQVDYEPFKSNILTVNEDVTLRGIGDVQDTLDCLTGEVVQSVGVLNGEETGWQREPHSQAPTDSSLIAFSIDLIKSPNKNLLSSVLVKSSDVNKPYRWYVSFNSWLVITLPKSEVTNLDEFKAWLKNNEVLYPLTEKSIKTVDLSSSGNWERVVLNGSESWNGFDPNYGCAYTGLTGKAYGFSNVFAEGFSTVSNYANAPLTISGTPNNSAIWLSIGKSIATLDQFKHYLSQNPVTVWYQTTTTLDSTQVKQPIFFKDGHIQLSSGADNSLIPTLDYQAKTSNSYVMDLMKNGVWYTMKAKSASGTLAFASSTQSLSTNGKFAVDGASFQNANKLMVINGSVEDLMILEGDLTSKTIPYFTGIKSAFEGEDKIEVLSTGKNLYSHGDSAFTPERDGWYFINGDRETLFGDKVHKDCGQGAWFYLEGGRYYFNVVGNDNVKTLQVIGEKERLYGSGATIPKGWYALRMRVQNANQEVSITNVMVEKDTETNYEPYKSNSTKIPLLSPLRSLQNGVCDELIIDRMKKKATLIQRVGHVMLDGSEEWGVYPTMEQDKTLLFQSKADCKQGKSSHCVSDRFPYSGSLWNSGFDGEGVMMGGGGSTYKRVDLRIYKGKVSSNNTTILREYLSKKPVTVCYELATPVVTEIDLENFPLVYKDGHIFLNSEIAPVVEIDYNINQSQQIQANNETLQRHELDILDLDNLIVSFVNAEYNLRLLKFDMELSMMALAE